MIKSSFKNLIILLEFSLWIHFGKAFSCPFEEASFIGNIPCFEPTAFTFPFTFSTPIYAFSIDTAFTVTTVCDIVTPYDFDLLTLTIDNGGPVELFKVVYKESGPTYELPLNLPGGPDTFSTPITAPIPITDGQGFEVFVSFDFTNDKASVGFSYPEGFSFNQKNGLDFGTWIFNSLATLSYGYAAVHSGAGVSTDIYSAPVVWFDYFESENELVPRMFGLSPSLIHKFEMTEGTEFSLTNTGTSSNPASLGLGSSSSSDILPKWISDDPGLEFTSPDQYVTLPPVYILWEQSFTISFWLRYETASLGWIFRCTDSSLTSLGIGIQLLANGRLLTVLSNANIYTTTSPVPVSTWTLITATYRPSYFTGFIFIYYDSTVVLNSVFASAPPPDTAKVFLGGPDGFIGKIVHLRMYNPGALYIGASCSAAISPCPMEIGIDESSPQCLFTPCFSLSNCETCAGPYGCELCESTYYRYEWECYLNCKTFDRVYTAEGTTDGGFCYDCPDHCSSCTGNLTCTSCDSGFGLSNSLCVPCSSVVLFDDDSCGVEPTINNLNQVASPIIQITRLVSGGSSSSVSAGALLDLFTNIKYYKIPYSPKLQKILFSWNPQSDPIIVSLEMTDSMQSNFPRNPLADIFKRYKIHSSFLVNFWNCLISLLIIIAVFLLSRTIQQIASKYPEKKILNTVTRLLRVKIQNYALAQAFGSFGEMTFNATLGFQTNSFSNLASVISFLISLFCLFAFSSVFLLQFRTLKQYQKVKRSGEQTEKNEPLEKFKEDNEGNEVFFKDLKDESIIHQSLLLLIILREFIFYTLLSSIPNHPLIQVCTSVILTLAMLFYLITKRPFQNILHAIQQLVLETSLLIVNILLLANIIVDSSDTKAISDIGDFLIAINIAFNFITMIFLVLGILIILYQQIQKFRKSRKEKKIHPVKTVSSDDTKLFSNMMDSPSSPVDFKEKQVFLRPKRPVSIDIEKVPMVKSLSPEASGALVNTRTRGSIGIEKETYSSSPERRRTTLVELFPKYLGKTEKGSDK